MITNDMAMVDPLLGERFGYQRAVEKLRGDDVLELLVAHTRSSDSGCSCGWRTWGHRYSRHVADALADWLDTEAGKIYSEGTRAAMSDQPSPREILALPLRPDNDAGATTVRGYLVELLAVLWDEGEMFSGKRPFGESGWVYELYQALATAGLVSVVLDEDGFFDTFPDSQRRRADKLIADAIRSLGDQGSGS